MLEERDHRLLGTRGQADAEKNALCPRPIVARCEPGHDAEPLTGQPRRIGERLGVPDDHVEPGAGDSVELAQRAEQLFALLNVFFRYGRAHKGLDGDGPIRRQRRHEPARVGAERVQLLGGHVSAHSGERGEEHSRAEGRGQGTDTDDVVEAHAPCCPVPAPEKGHVGKDAQHAEQHEIQHGREADDAAGEVGEVDAKTQSRHATAKAVAKQ